MEISWFDDPEHSSGSTDARISAGTASVRVLVGDKLALIVKGHFSSTGRLVIAFTASWEMAYPRLLPLIGMNGYIQINS